MKLPRLGQQSGEASGRTPQREEEENGESEVRGREPGRRKRPREAGAQRKAKLNRCGDPSRSEDSSTSGNSKSQSDSIAFKRIAASKKRKRAAPNRTASQTIDTKKSEEGEGSCRNDKTQGIESCGKRPGTRKDKKRKAKKRKGKVRSRRKKQSDNLTSPLPNKSKCFDSKLSKDEPVKLNGIRFSRERRISNIYSAPPTRKRRPRKVAPLINTQVSPFLKQQFGSDCSKRSAVTNQFIRGKFKERRADGHVCTTGLVENGARSPKVDALNLVELHTLRQQIKVGLGGIRPLRLGESLELFENGLPNQNVPAEWAMHPDAAGTGPEIAAESLIEEREAQAIEEIFKYRRKHEPRANNHDDSIRKRRRRRTYGQREKAYAATIIQCFWRLKISGRRVEEKRQERWQRRYDAAVKLQTQWRCRKAREDLANRRFAHRCMLGARAMQRIWRGLAGRHKAQARREFLARLELERQMSTLIQSVARAWLARRRIARLNDAALCIQSSIVRIQFARTKAEERRRAAKLVGHFGRFAAGRIRYLRILDAALVIECWARFLAARALVRQRRQERIRNELNAARNAAAVRLQALFRGARGRARAAQAEEARKQFLASLQQDDVSLVLAHCVDGIHEESPEYLKQRYREKLLEWPESAVLAYGRALLAVYGERDEAAAKLIASGALALDPSSHQLAVMELVLRQKGDGSAYVKAKCSAYLATLWILLEPVTREGEAMDLFENVLVQCDNAEDAHQRLVKRGKARPQDADKRLARVRHYAERYLIRYQREISAGSFSTLCFEGEISTISGLSGALSCWKRGLNFRFVFSHLEKRQAPNDAAQSRAQGLQSEAAQSSLGASPKRRTRLVTSAKPQVTLKKELVLTTKDTRDVVRLLDAPHLLRPANHDELLVILRNMLTLHVQNGKLQTTFVQEPFPRVTHLAPSGTFLSVVAFPADPSAAHALDLALSASDRAIGEEYTLRIPNRKIGQLFADETLLLRARTRPGWRRACRPLITRLIAMLDVQDVGVPVVGDYVVSIDPIWRAKKEAEVQRGFDLNGELQGARWYRLGRVSQRNGLTFTITPLAEKHPRGSLIFERILEDGAPKASRQARPYVLDLWDLRLATMRSGRSAGEIELAAPRIRLAEPPRKPMEQFRVERQRRRLVLMTEEREKQAMMNVAATQIQRIERGRKGRQLAYKVFLGKCATRIAKQWRMTHVLSKRVAELALQYRRKMAAWAIQQLWRRFVAQKRCDERAMECFHTTDVKKGLEHLKFLFERGVLGRHAFGLCHTSAKSLRLERLANMPSSAGPDESSGKREGPRGDEDAPPNSDSLLESLETVLAKYNVELEANPFDSDLNCGYVVVRNIINLLRQDATRDSIHQTLKTQNRTLDAQVRKNFRSAHGLYFGRAAAVYCESPLAWVQVSVVQRLVFADANAARHAAECAQRLVGRKRANVNSSCNAQDGALLELETLVSAALRISVVNMTVQSAAARKLQRCWRNRKRKAEQVQRPRAAVLLRRVTSMSTAASKSSDLPLMSPGAAESEAEKKTRKKKKKKKRQRVPTCLEAGSKTASIKLKARLGPANPREAALLQCAENLFRVRCEIASAKHLRCRALAPIRPHLRLAFALHARMISPLRALEMYFYALQRSPSSSFARDVRCCMGLLLSAMGKERAGSSERKALVSCAVVADCFKTLLREGRAFWSSHMLRYKKVLFHVAEQDPTPAVLLNCALIYSHCAANATETNAMIERALDLDPANVQLTQIVDEIKELLE